MPVTRSAKKKLRQDKKRQGQNLLVKKSVQNAVKAFKRKPSATLLSHVFQQLDLAVKKKIFHKNKVARLKSNLSRFFPKTKETPQKKAPKKK